MSTEYERPKPGEWVQPIKLNYKLACCDCGLVHKMNFRVVRGHVQFQAWRDYGATKRLRKKDWITCK